MDDNMVKKNLYFPPALWERLVELSEREGVAVVHTLRRLLSTSLGLDEALLAEVQLAADAGDPVKHLKRDLLHQRIQHGKVANRLERLAMDVTDLAGAEAPRIQAWEAMKSAMTQLHHDMQTHVDRSEGLFKQTSGTIAALYQGLLDLRHACEALQNAEEPRRGGWQRLVDSVNMLADRLDAQDERLAALYNGIKQLSMLDVDLLRRLSAVESGIVDDQVLEARERGNEWLTRVETDLLTHSSGTERGQHE